MGAVWVLVFCASVLGPLLPVLGALRMLAGGAQLGLNHALARRMPIAGRDRVDWVLLGFAFAGSVLSATLVEVTGSTMPLFVLPLLIPYSGLQIRSYRRSLDAHRVQAEHSMLEPLAFRVGAVAVERQAA